MSDQPAISIRNLVKRYAGTGGEPGKLALEGVSFDVPEGGIFGLLGPNGAGKSTIINILAGLVKKTEGEVSIWGFDIDRDLRNAKRAIGIVPQEVVFDPFFTPFEVLENQAGLYGVRKELRRSMELLRAVHLEDKAHAYSRTLSGGMRRRLLIAKALVHTPPVLVLDEPTAGVDVELRRQLWELVREMNARGMTIVLTTHYLEEAEELCERIAIINHGQLIANQPTARTGRHGAREDRAHHGRQGSRRPADGGRLPQGRSAGRAHARNHLRSRQVERRAGARADPAARLCDRRRDHARAGPGGRVREPDQPGGDVTGEPDRRQHHDVIVVGSGAAGLTAALALAEKLKVLVLAKGSLTGGSTAWAQGGIAAVLDAGDTFEEHIRDTMVAGAGLNRLETVEHVIERAPHAIDRLASLGVPFNTEQGALHLTREGGHSHRRIVHVDDATGWAVQSALVEAASSNPNITLLPGRAAIDLITGRHEQTYSGSGRVWGVYALDEASGEVEAHTARATVLATGGAGRVYQF